MGNANEYPYNNSFLKSLYEEKKINVLIAFFISNKNSIKTFLE